MHYRLSDGSELLKRLANGSGPVITSEREGGGYQWKHG